MTNIHAAEISYQKQSKKLTCVVSEGTERTVLLHKGFLGAQ